MLSQLNLSEEVIHQIRGRAQLYLEQGAWERAIVILDMLAELFPEDALFKVLAVHCLLELKESRQAEERLRKLDADAPLTQTVVAQLHLVRGEWQKAADILTPLTSREDAAGRRARFLSKRAHDAFEAQRKAVGTRRLWRRRPPADVGLN